MHFGKLTLCHLAVIPSLVVAHSHGVPGAPRIFGSRSAVTAVHSPDLKIRSLPYAKGTQNNDHPVRRQVSLSTDGQCGPGHGSCAAGYCCSLAGWCGQGTQYCAAPGCQYNYGPACDDNAVPPGANTSTIARPKTGNIAYGGAGLYHCTVPGTIAITYDDGPYIYTNDVLDVLKNYSAKATFFITGNNNGKGEIDNVANGWSDIVQRAHNEGHQIASHTWSHPHLSNLTAQQRKQNMWSNEMALRNILGFFPTYMRPPYSDCTAESGCQADMAELGYHIIYFDVDTDDYDNDSPALIQNAKNNFDNGIEGSAASTAEFLVIGHDIHEQTAHNLTAYMLGTLLAQGYKPVTVGECLGDPEENWYRSSSGSVYTSSTVISSISAVASAASAATAVSTDATCGGKSGFTCVGSTFGNCCSPNGWCGMGDAYCGEDCQADFGVCGINVSKTSSTEASGATTTTTAPASATVVSSDASCGGTTGYTCQGSVFGSCCSVNGWCGSTEAYCDAGCQPVYGTCSGSGILLTAVQQATSIGVTKLQADASGATSKTSTPLVSTTSTKHKPARNSLISGVHLKVHQG